jgi:subtilisin family serine protease
MAVSRNSRKLHPWLRIVRNGDRSVNSIRSDGSARVASAASLDQEATATAPIYQQLAQLAAPMPRMTEQVEAPKKRLKALQGLAKRPKAEDAYVNVFIEFYTGQQGNLNLQESIARVEKRVKRSQKKASKKIPTLLTTRRSMMCATVPVAMLDDLSLDPAVAYIHASDALTLDEPEITAVSSQTVPTSKAIGDVKEFGRGKGVLIGIIDVGGFDFSHPDFLDKRGNTRFVAIWDQGGTFRKPPKGFSRGSEFRQKEMNAAIAASKKRGMPPAPWIERQSQMQPASHGTHVASIAAGNSGVCPEAKIAAVLIDVPAVKDDVERRRTTFSDSSAITHAVEYLLGIAQEEDLPISINISLGTNGGSHDGASGVSRWLDAYLQSPGRAICVAAGNAGQEKAHSDGDLGWVMGRIHTCGQIASRGLEVELEWTVIGDGLEDWSENEFELWYSAQDRFSVALKPPGEDWIEVGPRQFVENQRLPNGVFVSIYNELYHPTNGCNYIAIYMSPNLTADNFRGIPKGIWRVRVRGEEVRDGRFNAWIERDDPLEIGRSGRRRMFRFPSFFSEKTNVDSHSISSLACGHRVIAVANLDEARQQINASSSQGPTRDGRCKPEIAAPGTNIVAANGFAGAAEPWIAMTGTSMASPFVTGVLGLMLAENRQLTAAQCLGILQRTSRPLAGASYQWANDVGFGRIHAAEALREAKTINLREAVSTNSRT